MLLKDMAGRRDFCHGRSKAHMPSECLSILLSDLVLDALHGNLQKYIYRQGTAPFPPFYPQCRPFLAIDLPLQ